MEKAFCERCTSSKVKEEESDCTEAAEEGMGPLQGRDGTLGNRVTRQTPAAPPTVTISINGYRQDIEFNYIT